MLANVLCDVLARSGAKMCLPKAVAEGLSLTWLLPSSKTHDTPTHAALPTGIVSNDRHTNSSEWYHVFIVFCVSCSSVHREVFTPTVY